MKIIVDGFGGDHAPEEIVKGIVEALNSDKELFVIVTGQKEVLESELAKHSYDKARLEIIDCREVITNDDVPTSAIRQKADSSLVVALKRLKEDDEVMGLVSAGSTGAVLAGGLMKVGRIKGISRPALCPALPTKIDGKNVFLLDCGANVDCKPINLCHFAVLGSCYAKAAAGVKSPKVALLSNGTEDKKGNALNHEAFPLLKEMDCIDFTGNMEARDILSGDADVIVTDGFAGNVALKATEGAVVTLLKMIKEGIMSTTKGKIGGMFLKSTFNKLKDKMDYSKGGGAVFLGLEKIIVKAHGSSKAVSIAACIKQAKEVAANNLTDTIKDMLKDLKIASEE